MFVGRRASSPYIETSPNAQLICSAGVPPAFKKQQVGRLRYRGLVAIFSITDRYSLADDMAREIVGHFQYFWYSNLSQYSTTAAIAVTTDSMTAGETSPNFRTNRRTSTPRSCNVSIKSPDCHLLRSSAVCS